MGLNWHHRVATDAARPEKAELNTCNGGVSVAVRYVDSVPTSAASVAISTPSACMTPFFIAK